MTSPITPNPAIHNRSPQDQTNVNNAVLAQMRAIFAQLPNIILKQVVAYIKQTTGIDLTGFLKLANDLGSALGMTGSLGSFLPQLEGAFQGINLTVPGVVQTISNDATGALNNAVQALTNLIDPSRLPVLPVSNIGSASPNLLLNGGFDTSVSLDGQGIWVWDGTVGRTALGSAKVVADGTQKFLDSNDIQVTAGQQFAIDGFVQWSGVTATGSAFQLLVACFDATGAEVTGALHTVQTVSSPAASGTWTHLTGTFTVPAGVATVRVRLIVAATVTAGSVWWDDLSATKTGLLSPGWMSGLTGGNTLQADLTNLFSGFGSTTWSSFITDLFGTKGLAANALNPSSPLPAGNLIGTVASSLVPDIQNTWNAIAGGLGGLLTGNNLTNVQNQAAQVSVTAQQAAAAAAAANATLAQQQGQNNAGANGLSFNTSFGGVDGAALTVSDFSGAGDIQIRGSNGYAGLKATDPDGKYYTICSHQFLTDNQSISVVLGDQGGSTAAATVLLFHCDTTAAVGAYASITNAGVSVGFFTRSGTAFTLTPFSGGSWAGALGQGARVEVHNVGTTYTVLVNGIPELTVTDSGAHVAMDASHRNGAIIMSRATAATGWFFGTADYDSFRLASLTLSDFVVPTFVGSGALIVRTSTATVTLSSSAINGVVLPTSLFNTTVQSTSDITVDLVNAKFTVASSGWYMVKMRVGKMIPGASALNLQVIAPVLFKNAPGGSPAVYQFGPFSAVGIDTNGSRVSDPQHMEGDFIVYLAAGESVQGGYATNIPGTTVAGEALGVYTYQSIALINRSQL